VTYSRLSWSSTAPSPGIGHRLRVNRLLWLVVESEASDHGEVHNTYTAPARKQRLSGRSHSSPTARYCIGYEVIVPIDTGRRRRGEPDSPGTRCRLLRAIAVTKSTPVRGCGGKEALTERGAARQSAGTSRRHAPFTLIMTSVPRRGRNCTSA